MTKPAASHEALCDANNYSEINAHVMRGSLTLARMLRSSSEVALHLRPSRSASMCNACHVGLHAATPRLHTWTLFPTRTLGFRAFASGFSSVNNLHRGNTWAPSDIFWAILMVQVTGNCFEHPTYEIDSAICKLSWLVRVWKPLHSLKPSAG